jgi:phosphodiesterase/alkaline phosphatase D-like protein
MEEMGNRAVSLGCTIAIVMCSGLQTAGLQAAVSTPTSITLTWTAPGDDNRTGQSSVYDIRYSLATITTANWASATKVTGTPAPKVAGSAESFDVTGLTSNTAYYFAMKAGDEVPNWSALSNVIQKSTSMEATPPSAITNLSAGTVTTSSVALAWTAPGDDGNIGTATTYDIRYSTSAITSANFASAISVIGEPAPKVAGSAETYTVLDLSSSTSYYFAIKTADEVPNWSGLSNEFTMTTCGGGVCTGTPGNVDCSPDESVDISDLTALIHYLFQIGDPMCICLAEANIDADVSNSVDVADLTLLIDYLFVSRIPMSPCP